MEEIRANDGDVQVKISWWIFLLVFQLIEVVLGFDFARDDIWWQMKQYKTFTTYTPFTNCSSASDGKMNWSWNCFKYIHVMYWFMNWQIQSICVWKRGDHSPLVQRFTTLVFESKSTFVQIQMCCLFFLVVWINPQILLNKIQSFNFFFKICFNITVNNSN